MTKIVTPTAAASSLVTIDLPMTPALEEAQKLCVERGESLSAMVERGLARLAREQVATQPLVTLNLTAEQFEMALESAACSLRTEISGGLKLDGAELLAAAEEQLSADAIRASGQRYLAAAEHPENAERAEHIRELGTEKLEEAEELAEFYAEAIGLYRALLAQAPQLVA